MDREIHLRMDIKTKQESYAERRKLFKNIWDTAMQIDEKDADILAKPKVIKTLRLDEMDRCDIVGKRRKEKIRNLRTVCEKILNFCDRQDADDMLNEQKVKGKDSPRHNLEYNRKKIIKHHRRKKVKRAKGLFVSENTSGDQVEATTSERKDSPIKTKRNTVVRRILVTHRRTSKVKSKPDAEAEGNNPPGKGSATCHKVITKKQSKLKKPSSDSTTAFR